MTKKVDVEEKSVSLVEDAVFVLLAELPSNLFSRGTYETGLDKTSGLLFDKVVRSLPMSAFVPVLARMKQARRFSPLIFLAFALALIADFPTGMARYQLAAFYEGMALLGITPPFEKRGIFLPVFLATFLLLLSAPNTYSYEAFDLSTFIGAFGDAIVNLLRGFYAVDYDAYGMFARTARHVSQYGSMHGHQLIGAIFLVPRAFWIIKLDGWGNLVCLAQGQTQLNMSCPLLAEDLISFRLVSLIVFAAVAGMLCTRIDGWFLESSSLIGLLYPSGCLLVFFIMLGGLLLSFASISARCFLGSEGVKCLL